MKGLVENLKVKVTEEFQKKTQTISKFEEAYEKMLKENEAQSQDLIMKYLKVKKHLVQEIEDGVQIDRQARFVEVYEYLNNLEESLVEKEMVIKNRL